MLLKKIALYHLLPACLAAPISLAFIKQREQPFSPPTLNSKALKQLSYIDVFHTNDLTQQLAFSLALKQKVPVLMGSSELTSRHLPGLAQNFFTAHPGERFLSFGHAGCQSLAMLTVLAANKQLLKDSKLTIILSPGWFEKEYHRGTSLSSFFEFCPPNYLYQIYKDTNIGLQTQEYLAAYISKNFDKISRPDPVLRILGLKQGSVLKSAANYPFEFLDKQEIKKLETEDPYLVSQGMILQALSQKNIPPYHFKNAAVNWDSLQAKSGKEFRLISNNNNLAVENSYYDQWLRGRHKKRLVAVDAGDNQEFKDFKALVSFLKEADCDPLFVIMPLNKKAHEDVSVMLPMIDDITKVLAENKFRFLNMYSPNAESYQDGVLEDIMHPYNTGWYQIDKFILDNYHDR